jgi:hypothetical protein
LRIRNTFFLSYFQKSKLLWLKNKNIVENIPEVIKESTFWIWKSLLTLFSIMTGRVNGFKIDILFNRVVHGRQWFWNSYKHLKINKLSINETPRKKLSKSVRNPTIFYKNSQKIEGVGYFFAWLFLFSFKTTQSYYLQKENHLF